MDTEERYAEFTKRLAAVGFESREKPRQSPHFRKDLPDELVFHHPTLLEKWETQGKRTKAKTYYIKVTSAQSDADWILTTGKTSVLLDDTYFAVPNATDIWGMKEGYPAWVDSDGGRSALEELLESIAVYLEIDRTVDHKQLRRQFDVDVARISHEPRRLRLQRLESVPTYPEKFTVRTVAFRRNPDVVAEVLHRAAGACEECLAPAPFIRLSDGTPFLEVHHVVALSEMGEDTVSNAIALCPNCHRRMHHG